MSEWTPGPWTAGHAYRTDGDGEVVPLVIGPNGENPVAEVTLDFDADMTGEVPAANARLIALAPEMADMIEQLLIAVRAHFQPQGIIPADVGDPMLDAIGLLARARGETA